MSKGLGETQKKILLLLTAGVALGFSGSPRRHFQILKELGKEWKEINRQSLRRAIKNLYESKLIKEWKSKNRSAGTANGG